MARPRPPQRARVGVSSPPAALALAVGVASFAAAACTTWRRAEPSCRLGDDAPQLARGAVPAPVPAPPNPNLDLSDLHLFRSYLAVTGVSDYGHHFRVSYHNVERASARLRAEIDATGTLRLTVANSEWGGIAAMVNASPPPAELAALGRAVEAELPRRCPAGRDWSVAYDGSYRLVTVRELIPHDVGGSGTRTRGAGWTAWSTLRSDRDLTRITGATQSMSGFGVIELPAVSHWVTLDPAAGSSGRWLISKMVGAGGELDALVTAAARRVLAGAPPTPIAAVPVPAPAALLPPGYQPRVTAVIAVGGRGQGSPGDRNGPSPLRLPLDLRRAVSGPGAEARGISYVAGTRVDVSVTLTPVLPRIARSERVREPYLGRLTVRAEDEAGNRWERDYPATGPIIAQGEDVVAPVGLELPGASAPSAAYDALRGELPGATRFRGIDLRVDVSLYDDPRRP